MGASTGRARTIGTSEVASGRDAMYGLIAFRRTVSPETYWASRAATPAGRCAGGSAKSPCTCAGGSARPVFGSLIVKKLSTREMPGTDARRFA